MNRGFSFSDIGVLVDRLTSNTLCDTAEGRIQVGANKLHSGDDCERDAGGNQAVLDSGCAGLVIHETRNKILHLKRSKLFD
jgi:hypothetical protein